MIDQALLFLRDELNAFLLTRTNSTNVEVKLSKLVTETGKLAFPEENIALTVFNIEEDQVFKSQLPEFTYVNGQHIRLEPDLKFCLHLMFAANFKVYEEAWKALSLVLTFFQSHTSFTTEEYPALSPKIGKLNLEQESLNFEQLNQVWSYLGAKHMPNITYKVRLVIIQDEAACGIQKPIITIQTNLKSK